MSKFNATKERIFDKALEMFNERGIEYVGLRELAALLDMRVSNITYYFPTKDDLVYEISQALRKRNSDVMVVKENMSMLEFLQMLELAFKNHIQFRCLLLSVVHIMQQNRRIAASYKKTQGQRNSNLELNLQVLSEGGFLRNLERSELQNLVSTLSLISRFWISEAVISFREETEEEQIAHYLELIKQLLLPYATAKGKKQIGEFAE
jgi:AcrR family transcriptional regulator